MIIKSIPAILALLFCSLVATGQESKEPAPNSFEAKVTAFQAADKNTVNRALVTYLSRLDTLRQKMTERGDLDAVLAVKAEEERVGTAQKVDTADIVAKPPELNFLMKAFVQGMETHKKNQQTRFKTMIEQERASLQRQITELTKANKIDEAIAKKAELAAFDAKLRAIFVAAKPAMRPVAANPGADPVPGAEGLRVDEEGRVDLTMGRDGGAAEGKKGEGRPFKPGKADRPFGKPGKPFGKRPFFDR